jgi:AcrR family transcriptional regulator
LNCTDLSGIVKGINDVAARWAWRAPDAGRREVGHEMTETKEKRGPVRERLLAAANELFYEEGIQTVGIDRVIARAGVAKASLYNAFGGKDALIRAYLAARHDVLRQRVERGIADRHATPRDRLLGVFEVLGEIVADPGFRGCAFMNASAEAQPGSPVEQAADEYRAWVHDLFRGLVRDAGAAHPDALAAQLVLLYDGATVSARMDRNPAAGATARAIAGALVDAAIAR